MEVANDAVVRLVTGREDRIELILNRPAKLNALTEEMLAALRQAAVDIDDGGDRRPVVVRSSVHRAFSVGADLSEWRSYDAVAARRASLRGLDAFEAIASLPQPVIAELDGHCLGGGLELALAADFRIATADARLGFPEVGLGTATSWGGMTRLVETTGLACAKELMLTGRIIDAQAAHRLRMVTMVVQRGALAQAVTDLLAELNTTAPVAQHEIKRMLNSVGHVARGRDMESMSAGLFAATADAAEGKAAFAERRSPEFKGR